MSGRSDASDKGDGSDKSGVDADAEKRDLTFGLAIGGAVVAAGLAASWAMAEHASTGIQAGLAMPVDVLHLLVVAVWLGGLLRCSWRCSGARRDTDRRGGRTALLAPRVRQRDRAGRDRDYQSWRQVGSGRR